MPSRQQRSNGTSDDERWIEHWHWQQAHKQTTMMAAKWAMSVTAAGAEHCGHRRGHERVRLGVLVEVGGVAESEVWLRKTRCGTA